MEFLLRLPLVNRISGTIIKLKLARVLYRVLRPLLRGDTHRIVRDGICYEVDLRQGIDLSIFLLGKFQASVFRCLPDQLPYRPVATSPTEAIVFDIGANIGAMTLRLAQRYPNAVVWAFEPTEYGFAKLQTNVSLNPLLAERIWPHQIFFAEMTASTEDISAYARWNIDQAQPNAHPLHGGSLESTARAAVWTVDDFCTAHGIARVDLIKIDTDGHELRVLRGAQATMRRSRPVIIFEIGRYLLEERGQTIADFLRFFDDVGYELVTSSSGHQVNWANAAREIPPKQTTDLVAYPIDPSPGFAAREI